MSPVELFNIITEKGSYIIGYLADGWTKEIIIRARCPNEAMIKVQNIIGDICNVTFVERKGELI